MEKHSAVEDFDQVTRSQESVGGASNCCLDVACCQGVAGMPCVKVIGRVLDSSQWKLIGQTERKTNYWNLILMKARK